MRFLLLSLLALRAVVARPSLAGRSDPFAQWAPPGPGDGESRLCSTIFNGRKVTDSAIVRAPCPLLNTLANHGFINRNGKNLTEPQITTALSSVINMEQSVGAELFSFALKTVPPNSTAFDLDNLRAHNILEHDGSLRYTPQLVHCLPHYSIPES